MKQDSIIPQDKLVNNQIDLVSIAKVLWKSKKYTT